MSIENRRISKEKINGTLLFSAIGDALGWPNEFFSRKTSIFPDFRSWKKLVGGKYWGYETEIQPGEYSDDTQLTLAVARSILKEEAFDFPYLAFEEFPVWLTYQRGGGKALKTSIRKLLRVGLNMNPFNNFYSIRSKTEYVDYRDAGANGSAMRILPIAIATVNDRPSRLFQLCWYNTIITHGHPRAILGTILYAFLIRHFLLKSSIDYNNLKPILENVIDNSFNSLNTDPIIKEWLTIWNKGTLNTFEVTYKKIQEEARDYLHKIPQFLDKDPLKYYEYTRALSDFKGSGLSTVFCALYMFFKYFEKQDDGIVATANLNGSDTDTIGYFLGGLYGAQYGDVCIPKRFLSQLQDKQYFYFISEHLHNLIEKKQEESPNEITLKDNIPMNGNQKIAALGRLKIWDEEIRDIFYEFSEGERIFHPLFGKGKIIQSKIVPTKREGYSAKIVKVVFDSMFTCHFSTRFQASSDILSVDDNYSTELESLCKGFNLLTI